MAAIRTADRPRGGCAPRGSLGAIVGRRAPSSPPRLARAVAVTSGKGGVGKSNIAVNLAACMSRLGRRVLLLDADLGTANADVLCDIHARRTIEHVVSGACSLGDTAVKAPGGFRLVPGASGTSGLADLRAHRRNMLIEQLAAIESEVDVFLLDTGAGIGSNVVAFAAAADTILVVTTPEPTAIMDTYAMLKALRRQRSDATTRLVVNMAADEDEAADTHRRLQRASATFLDLQLPLAGWVPFDGAVIESVRRRVPFVIEAPTAWATARLGMLAADLCGLDATESSDPGPGFLGRLADRLGFSRFAERLDV